MGKAVTIVRTQVGTFGRKISRFKHCNFHTVWLVSLTNKIVESTTEESSSPGFVAHSGYLFRTGSSETHFLGPWALGSL